MLSLLPGEKKTTGEGHNINIPLKGVDGGADFRSRMTWAGSSLLPAVLAFDIEASFAQSAIGRLTQGSERRTFDELFHSRRDMAPWLLLKRGLTSSLTFLAQ
jgi:hypothetical protein